MSWEARSYYAAFVRLAQWTGWTWLIRSHPNRSQVIVTLTEPGWDPTTPDNGKRQIIMVRDTVPEALNAALDDAMAGLS